ncbi:ORF59 [callitrichine gammaherpesvirus 3]|uniref:Small capsomere-interacting protein n=1 Tax=callitrichine gammaherpesvirus 3 TaxID=106331 RepID=Q8BEN7_9GAMA|nr:ORF59 [callitrichine gammaherpesvirus 3]AAN64280.1 ORF59 [callitrichine gammaherpesvirus 3]
MDGRRPPRPNVQSRLEADFPNHHLQTKFMELVQGNLSDKEYREAQAGYLTFLIAEHCYENYVQRMHGVLRRQVAQARRGAASTSSHIGSIASAATGTASSVQPSASSVPATTPSPARTIPPPVSQPPITLSVSQASGTDGGAGDTGSRPGRRK